MSTKLYKHVYELTIYSKEGSSLEKELAGYLDMLIEGIEDERDVITAFFAVCDPVQATPEEFAIYNSED